MTSNHILAFAAGFLIAWIIACAAIIVVTVHASEGAEE